MIDDTIWKDFGNVNAMTDQVKRPPIMERILIIDFEASGLHTDSYPTEIAWMDPVHDEEATSFLIRPSDRWLKSHWDHYAESLTGITKKMIIEEGQPIQDVAAMVKKAMDDADIILSDAPEWDWEWMWTLFKAAGIEAPIPTFTAFNSFLKREYDKDIAFEEDSAHRADKDVEQLAKAFKLATLGTADSA